MGPGQAGGCGLVPPGTAAARLGLRRRPSRPRPALWWPRQAPLPGHGRHPRPLGRGDLAERGAPAGLGPARPTAVFADRELGPSAPSPEPPSLCPPAPTLAGPGPSRRGNSRSAASAPRPSSPFPVDAKGLKVVESSRVGRESAMLRWQPAGGLARPTARLRPALAPLRPAVLLPLFSLSPSLPSSSRSGRGVGRWGSGGPKQTAGKRGGAGGRCGRGEARGPSTANRTHLTLACSSSTTAPAGETVASPSRLVSPARLLAGLGRDRDDTGVARKLRNRQPVCRWRARGVASLIRAALQQQAKCCTAHECSSAAVQRGLPTLRVADTRTAQAVQSATRAVTTAARCAGGGGGERPRSEAKTTSRSREQQSQQSQQSRAPRRAVSGCAALRGTARCAPGQIVC